MLCEGSPLLFYTGWGPEAKHGRPTGIPNIPPLRKERGTSVGGDIWFKAFEEDLDLSTNVGQEELLDRLRNEAQRRPEKWTEAALCATYGHPQRRTALHFAAIRCCHDLDHLPCWLAMQWRLP